MREIRQISAYVPSIKDKYYVTDNGVVYVRNDFSRRIYVDGKTHNIKPWSKNALAKMAETYAAYTAVPDFGGQYILLRDGTLLKRLRTSLFHGGGKPRPTVGLYTTDDKRCVRQVGYFVARCFIDSTEGKEVHHVNNDPMDNRVANLRVVSREEHHAAHGWGFNDHPEREYTQAGGNGGSPVSQ